MGDIQGESDFTCSRESACGLDSGFRFKPWTGFAGMTLINLRG
jgi:hypothetical protein